MSGWLEVVPQDLHISASRVDMHADDLWTAHTAADSRIEGAERGLPAGAGAALGAAVTKWQTASNQLYQGLSSHSEGLRGAAAGYIRQDEHGAENVATAGEKTLDLGL